MKITYLAAAFAAVTLVACGQSGEEGGEDASLKRACMKIEADPGPAQYVDDAGIEFEAFCDCLSSRILALPEADQAEASAALLAVTDAMGADKNNTEDIVNNIRMRGEADDASEEDKVLAGSVDELGDLIGETIAALENGGTCPA